MGTIPSVSSPVQRHLAGSGESVLLLEHIPIREEVRGVRAAEVYGLPAAAVVLLVCGRIPTGVSPAGVLFGCVQATQGAELARELIRSGARLAILRVTRILRDRKLVSGLLAETVYRGGGLEPRLLACGPRVPPLPPLRDGMLWYVRREAGVGDAVDTGDPGMPLGSFNRGSLAVH